MLLGAWHTWRLIREARASGRWNARVIRRLQETRLRNLIQHAYQNVPMYRRLYQESGFEPGMVQSLDDIDRIPILTKRYLLESPAPDRLMRGIDPDDCRAVPTSGSTGNPLEVYLSREDVWWQRAVAWRILFEHGFRWTDRTLEIRMEQGAVYGIQKFGIAPKDWMSVLDRPEEWARCLARRRHQIVVASAGPLLALAEAAETLGLRLRPPRLIVSDSETLLPNARRFIHKSLGVDPIDVFGLVEVSNFAWECEQRNGFHISADSHIVEVAADQGEAGPLIVTALGMRTMPFIRYQTGDIADMSSAPCPCGRNLPLLGNIRGREWDVVVLPDGRRLFGPYFHEIFARYTELRQWQIVQREKRRLEIKLDVRTEIPGLTDRILKELRHVLPQEVSLHIQQVNGIQTPVGEKFKVIDSRL